MGMGRHWSALGLVVLVVLVMSPGCAPPVESTTSESDLQVSADNESASSFPTLTATTDVAASGKPCGVPPIVVPTPAHDPGITRLDLSTGLHVTGKMQLLDLDTYRLRVTGRVERPLELTYDEIRCLPKVQASPELICPGLFVDEATWAGVPIADVLDLAGVQGGAQSVKFVSADGYTTSLALEEALDRVNFLAYEWEGQPLPRLHGFPLRVVIPGAQGNQCTKWVVEMVVH
jgi:DMSO/TMAO reductase YedYZ molybdopterin-dependent catalytic subunit